MTPRKKSAATIADEQAQAAEIAKAHEFSAHFRAGPHDKITERGFPTYQAARNRLDEIEAQHSKFARRGIVYAINRLGSFPCTPELIAMAAEIKASAS